jgi:fructokinase
MNKKRIYMIVGLGEVLWDVFPQKKYLGGAPANFAYYVSMLGHKGIIASRIGKDELGKEILDSLTDLSLSKEYIQIDPNNPTGTVDVKIDSKGQPTFTINQNVAWDFLEFNEKYNQLAKRVDAVCFGSLAQRSPKSHNTIVEFLKHTQNDTLRIFDINLRQHFFSKKIIIESLQLSSILKLNDEELLILIDLLGYQNKKSEEELCRQLIEIYGLNLVCLTKGEKGSLLITDKEIVEHPGYQITVADTVGAGDAFAAAIIVKYLEGISLKKISEAANKLSSWVTSQHGATPPINKYILEELL